jgi:hypothetical protein
MRHVAPPLADLTAQAQTLSSAGDLAGARDVLADVLDPADADPQRASEDLALAAALQARILIALGDPHAARTWAGFAHAAEERLHGTRDERTIAAAATHAAVLHRVGNHGRAAQLYHELVGQLTELDGPLSARVLAAEADLATAEHAAGDCTAARHRLADAWARHNEAYGEDSPAGIKMLARLAAMERECGRTGDALRRFARAQELCARYLPPDHPLGRQVARLAGAQPSGRHVCGRVQRSTGPATAGPAAGVTRVPATTQGVHPVRQEPPAPGEPTGRHARPEPPIPLPLTSPAPPPTATPPPPAEMGPPPTEAVPPPTDMGRPPTDMGRPPTEAVPPPTEAASRPGNAVPPPQPEAVPPFPAEAIPPHSAEAVVDAPAEASEEPAAPLRREVTPPWPPEGIPAQRAEPATPLHGQPDQAVPVSPPAASPGAWSGPPPVPAQPDQTWPDQPEQARPDQPEQTWPNQPEQTWPAQPEHSGPVMVQPAVAVPAQPTYQPATGTPPQNWSVEPPGPWPPDSLPPTAHPSDAYPPGPRLPVEPAPEPVSDRRLPVPVERPDRHATRRSLVLAAVLVGGIAAAAAIVVATLPRDDPAPVAAPRQSATVAPASPSASVAPSSAAVAPAGLTLKDNRDSVSLTWRYPKGSEGPVVISGGRTGQEQRAFQQLPAGTTDYVVYGLNRKNDYCFAVAVVYTVDQVAASAPVCTDRS